MAIHVRGPTYAYFPLRAGGVLLLPINHNMFDGKSFPGTGLTMVILSCWPKQINSIGGSALHQQLRVQISCINNVLVRQEPLLLKRLVNLLGDLIIGDRRLRRLYMRDEAGGVIVAGFGEMSGCHLPTAGFASCCRRHEGS